MEVRGSLHDLSLVLSAAQVEITAPTAGAPTSTTGITSTAIAPNGRRSRRRASRHYACGHPRDQAAAYEDGAKVMALIKWNKEYVLLYKRRLELDQIKLMADTAEEAGAKAANANAANANAANASGAAAEDAAAAAAARKAAEEADLEAKRNTEASSIALELSVLEVKAGHGGRRRARSSARRIRCGAGTARICARGGPRAPAAAAEPGVRVGARRWHRGAQPPEHPRPRGGRRHGALAVERGARRAAQGH